MTTIVSGNWKMNGSRVALKEWFEAFYAKASEYEQKGEVNSSKIPTILLCLPDIYIEHASKLAKEFNANTKFKVYIGAEDCHMEDTGAFTGNNSAAFLKDFDCKYTLVGHSERRQFQGETSEMVAKKAAAALRNNVTPVVCFGEDLTAREKGTFFEFVKDQVLKSTEGIDLTKVVLAYEPVWAIGTGKVPSEADINEMEGFVRETLAKERGVDKNKLTLLYGGSVKASNAGAIIGLSEVNGVLVGGASMKGEEFFNIALGAL